MRYSGIVGGDRQPDVISLRVFVLPQAFFKCSSVTGCVEQRNAEDHFLNEIVLKNFVEKKRNEKKDKLESIIDTEIALKIKPSCKQLYYAPCKIRLPCIMKYLFKSMNR